jgi:hypothetical protein
MRDRGCSEQQGVELAQELRRYRSGVGEYSGLHVNPNTDARLWWQTRGMQSVGAEKLAELAELLQDIVPHAAAPERIFSTMGWTQNKTRNRLSAVTTTMLTTIKVFYDAQAPRSVPSISLVIPNCPWRVELKSLIIAAAQGMLLLLAGARWAPAISDRCPPDQVLCRPPCQKTCWSCRKNYWTRRST